MASQELCLVLLSVWIGRMMSRAGMWVTTGSYVEVELVSSHPAKGVRVQL